MQQVVVNTEPGESLLVTQSVTKVTTVQSLIAGLLLVVEKREKKEKSSSCAAVFLAPSLDIYMKVSLARSVREQKPVSALSRRGEGAAGSDPTVV